MAVVSVAFDGTRVNDADALGSVWTDLAGKAANAEPDFIYQLTSGTTGSVSEKVGTSEGGVALDVVTTIDFTTPRVWLAKIIATNNSILNNKGSTGGILEIGSGGRRSAYDRYYVVGGDTYPPKGGWLIIPIDPNGGNQSARPGSAPTLTAIDYFGWACTFSASSKSENVAMDAVDYITNGTGLTLTGGDGASTDGVFQDFIDADEGTATARWGVVQSSAGALIVTGVLTIGTATATEFTDTAAAILFPEAEFLNSTGFFGLDFGLQSASTAITISSCVFKSVGTTGGTVDTRPDYVVTGTSGTLSLTGSTFDTFRIVTLTSACTCTSNIFLNGGQITLAEADISGSSILTSTVAADEGAVFDDRNTTAATELSELQDCTFSKGTNAHHAIRFGVNVNDDLTLRGCDFSGFGSSNDANDSVFRFDATTGSINLNLIGCSHDGSGFTVDDAAGITVTVVIDPVTTLVNVKDNTGTNLQSARVILEASDGTGDFPYVENVSITRSATTATVTHTAHGLSTNDYVVIRGANQPEYNGPQQITVTGANTYTYTVAGSPATPATGNRLKDAQDETLYVTFNGGSGHSASDVLTLDKNVTVTVDAVNLGAVTQFTVSSVNARGGISVGDVLEQVSSTGSGTGFSLTVGSGNLTVSSSGAILSGTTDASGNISASRTFTTATPVKGSVRKSTASPRFKVFPISGTISTTAGLTINVQMILDE